MVLLQQLKLYNSNEITMHDLIIKVNDTMFAVHCDAMVPLQQLKLYNSEKQHQCMTLERKRINAF